MPSHLPCGIYRVGRIPPSSRRCDVSSNERAGTVDFARAYTPYCILQTTGRSNNRSCLI